jgi:nucleoid-associated protein YejK
MECQTSEQNLFGNSMEDTETSALSATTLPTVVTLLLLRILNYHCLTKASKSEQTQKKKNRVFCSITSDLSNTPSMEVVQLWREFRWMKLQDFEDFVDQELNNINLEEKTSKEKMRSKTRQILGMMSVG